MTPRGVGCLPPRPLALHPCSDIVHNIASAIEPAELESRSERGDRPQCAGWGLASAGVVGPSTRRRAPRRHWHDTGVVRVGPPAGFLSGLEASPRRWALPPCLRRGAAGRGRRRSPGKLASERKKAVRAPRA